MHSQMFLFPSALHNDCMPYSVDNHNSKRLQSRWVKLCLGSELFTIFDPRNHTISPNPASSLAVSLSGMMKISGSTPAICKNIKVSASNFQLHLSLCGLPHWLVLAIQDRPCDSVQNEHYRPEYELIHLCVKTEIIRLTSSTNDSLTRFGCKSIRISWSPYS